MNVVSFADIVKLPETPIFLNGHQCFQYKQDESNIIVIAPLLLSPSDLFAFSQARAQEHDRKAAEFQNIKTEQLDREKENLLKLQQKIKSIIEMSKKKPPIQEGWFSKAFKWFR